MTRSRRPPFAILACAAGLAASAGAPAGAQFVDHGALEDLFGEPITTSATGQPQRAADAPANMMIITADQIRRSGARDVADVLRHVGGVDVIEWTNGQTDVSIRGYNREFSPRLLVLIDGRQVYVDYYGFTPWSTLPVQLEEIRQIEVVKGPNAALFGFNAVGGVINIVTYDPMADDVGAASLSVGTQSFVGGQATETFQPAERLAFRLSAASHRAEDFSTDVPATFAAQRAVGYDRDAVALDGVIELSDSVRLRLDASRVEASQNEIAPSLVLVSSDYAATSWQGRLSADTGLGYIEATAYTNRIVAEALAEPSLPNFDFDSRVTVLRLEDLFTVGARHAFRGAGEYRRSTVNTTPEAGGEVAYDVYSVSGMWDWRITPEISLANAARLDRLELERSGAAPSGYPFTNADWDRVIEDVSFNSGLVWRLGERDTLRVIAARGVQLPSLTNLGALLIATPAFNVTGIPTIEPSTVSNFEIDWVREIESLNMTLRVSAFHQTTEDVVNIEGGAVFGPGGVYFTPINVGDSYADGIELGLDGEFGAAWRWGVDYRDEMVDDDYAPPTPGVEVTSNYEDTTPRRLLKARLGWSGGRWEADGYLRHQSATAGVLFENGVVTLIPVDAYTAIDGRVGYALTERATIAISGHNLGAPEHRRTAGPEIERRLMGTLTVRY